MNMNDYTIPVLADMEVLLFNCMGKRYPTRRQPNHQTFARLHQNLAVHGSIKATIESTGQQRIARTTMFEEGVLYAVAWNPDIKVRALAVAIGRSRTTVHRVLQGEALDPFHVRRVQLLQSDDHPRRIAFAHCFVNQSATGMHFFRVVL